MVAVPAEVVAVVDLEGLEAFVVEDRHYVSARWPGDAYLFAKRLLDRLT